MLFDEQEITAGYQTLFDQSHSSAHEAMRKAIDSIEDLLGKGMAIKHPSLIIAYMEYSSRDFICSSKGIQQQKNRELEYAKLERSKEEQYEYDNQD